MSKGGFLSVLHRFCLSCSCQTAVLKLLKYFLFCSAFFLLLEKERSGRGGGGEGRCGGKCCEKGGFLVVWSGIHCCSCIFHFAKRGKAGVVSFCDFSVVFCGVVRVTCSIDGG